MEGGGSKEEDGGVGGDVKTGTKFSELITSNRCQTDIESCLIGNHDNIRVEQTDVYYLC